MERVREPDLAALAHVLARLRAAGVELVLVGATAVRLHVDPEGAVWPRRGEPEAAWAEAGVLGRIVASTGDADLVVGDPGRVEEVLRAAGFESKGTGRWTDDGLLLDVMPGRAASGSTHLPIDRLETSERILAPGEPPVRVARPGTLVALKALAWIDRHEPRDLSDVAALAIRGRASGWPIREELARVAGALGAERALAEVGRHFADPDGRGPSSFAALVHDVSGLRGVPEWATDEPAGPWDRVEPRVRAVASEAVRWLLGGVDGIGEPDGDE